MRIGDEVRVCTGPGTPMNGETGIITGVNKDGTITVLFGDVMEQTYDPQDLFETGAEYEKLDEALMAFDIVFVLDVPIDKTEGHIDKWKKPEEYVWNSKETT